MSFKNIVSLVFVFVVSTVACTAQADAVFQCNMNHPGSTERGRVSIDANWQVTGFTWTLDKKAKGFCNILAETFHGVNSELFLGVQGCQLMTWRQGRRLTLALSPATPACRAYCSTQQAYESLLPIVFDGVGCSS